MIQIDPFLAYTFSAGLAIACRHPGAPRRPATNVPAEPSPDVGARQLAHTVLWLSLAFAPQAVYLMWRFPAWESMYVFPNREAIPPGLAAGVAASVVALGALGFWLTYRLLPTRPRLALTLAALSLLIPLCIVTVGWDGRGLQRMLFVGTYDAWAAGGVGSVAAFVRSDLALTLLWLQTILLVPYALMLRSLLVRRAATGTADGAERHSLEVRA